MNHLANTALRTLSGLDNAILGLDRAMRTVHGRPLGSGRADPASNMPEAELGQSERRVVEGLMRVNHSGEVSAQALYQGQALTARDPVVKRKLEQSAEEENDHLLWCESRVKAMGGHTSWLNPFWYAGSFAIGALAGWAGDRWSLGFVAETERQVVRHLDSHLEQLPEADEKSRAVVLQMREDEMHHATVALEHGAAELPTPIKRLMGVVSKVMTRTAYNL